MIFRYSIFFLFLLLIFSIEPASSQDPAYHQLTDDDGLPSLTIYKILQCHDGYIWMGTSNGICRYDGKEFKNYSDRRMKDKEIIDLEVDSFNQIWFRNLSNQLFCIIDGEIVSFDEMVNEEYGLIRDFGILENHIYIPIKEKESELYKIGRFKILANGTIEKPFIFKGAFIAPPPFIASENALLINLRVSINDKYFYFEIKNKNDELRNLGLNKKYTKDLRYPKLLYFDDDGKIIIYNSRQGELREFDQENSRLIFKSKENSFISGVEKINDNYFLLTKEGMIIIPNNSNEEENLLAFQGISCNSFFIDREGNIWIGTTESGIIFIPSLNMKLYNSKNSQLANDQVFSLFNNEKSNEIIVGQSNGHVSIIQHKEIEGFDLNTSGRVKGIYQSKNKDYYFFGTDSKSFYTHRNTQKNKPIFSTLADYRASVKTFFQDDERNIYYGESQSLEKVNSHPIIDSIFLSAEHILNKRTYAIEQDYLNNIWIGTTEGIYIYKNSIAKPLSVDNQILYNVSSFVETEDSIMWVATLGDGILGFKDFQAIYKFDDTNGMASNTCRKVYAKDGRLMVATDQGLNIVNYKTNSIELINKLDGLPTNDINDVIFGEKEIWVGTSKGLVNFPTELNHINKVAPNIHITAFKIWEKDTTLEKTFDLNYDQNNFQIEFVGLGFRARGNIRYQYKLTGVDSDWVITDTRSVRYPSVNPGDYTFEVYAINEDGIKSEVPATFSFQIAPPYWQTWWFIILSVLILASLIGLFFYWRFQRIRAKESFENEYIQKVNELEQKALQLQMNPHFIYNTLNAIQYFLTINDSKFAMLYLSRFAKMIRAIFEQSKNKTISLEEEIEFLKLYLKLEQLRFDNKIEVDLQVDENLENKLYDIKIPPLLLQPLIENSFKHGLFQKKEKGIIKINFKLKDEFLLCTIKDNGVGRKKAAEKEEWKPKNYVSSGIKNTSERLAILNGSKNKLAEKSTIEIIDLYDDFNQPCGTKVLVKIKYEKS